jgi:AbrB family looped-hinge helix DNA binding protein
MDGKYEKYEKYEKYLIGLVLPFAGDIVRGKHIVGSTKVGARGQIVLPKDIRNACNFRTGDTVVIAAHQRGNEWHVSLLKPEYLLAMLEHMKEAETKILAITRKAGIVSRKGSRKRGRKGRGTGKARVKKRR